MPSNVAWRFLIASAEYTNNKQNNKQKQKKAARKTSKKARAKPIDTKKKGAHRTMKVLKKPCGKHTALKETPKQDTVATAFKTPTKRTRPRDGTSPWSKHFSQ